MKKILFTLVLAFATSFAFAQRTPHAIGAHIGGSTIDFEYQYHFDSANFIDATVGIFDLGDGFVAQGVYNWNIKQWGDWTPSFGTWKLWGGVGVGVGFYDDDEGDGCLLGPVGNLGFGFTLKSCPLTVGIDYRPMVAFNLGNDGDLVNSGFWNFGLTVTYRF